MTDQERVDLTAKMLAAALDCMTPEEQANVQRIGMVFEMKDGHVASGEITQMEDQWPTPIN